MISNACTSCRAVARRPMVCNFASTALLALGLLAGCANEQQKINAIHAVNTGFRAEYERIVGELGTRKVNLPRREALLAMRVNGEDLALDHGYPLRLIAPNRPGVMQTKWVARVVVL